MGRVCFAVSNKCSQGISADDPNDILSEDFPKSKRNSFTDVVFIVLSGLKRIYSGRSQLGCVLLSLRERIKDPNSSLLPFDCNFKLCPGVGLASKRQSGGFEI